MNKLKLFLIIAVSIFLGNTASAQLQLNGSIDIGIRSGGENSSFVKNGVESNFKYLHFRIPQVNLFMFAPINDNFFFEARLQSDTWGTGELKDPYFTLANVTWADPNKDYTLTLGRYVSPVGHYSSKNLLIDRTFHELPLTYSYFVNISDQRGFWPLAGEGGAYTSSDVGLTTIYFGGYATGGLLDWQIKENKTRLQIGLSSVAPSSAENYTNLANAAITGRLTLNPNIKWEIGLTGSYGSFMTESTINSSFRPFNPLERYRQTLIGSDLRYGFGYWEIKGEAIFSYWYVPIFGDTGFETVGATNQFEESNFSNLGTNLDIRFEPPSLVGSYFAVRFDYMNFMGNGEGANSIYTSNEWDKDIGRISAAFGYKLGRNIEAKFSFSDQTPFDTSLYTFRSTISAFF
jgi:hypothetical protein